MSVLDKDCFLSNAQAITASAASDDYFSFGSGWNALGQEMYLGVQVTTTFDSANDTGTLAVSARVDDNTSFSSARTLVSSKAYTITDMANDGLVEGQTFYVPIPWQPELSEKYFDAYYTVGTQNFSAGAVNTFITTNPPRQK